MVGCLVVGLLASMGAVTHAQVSQAVDTQLDPLLDFDDTLSITAPVMTATPTQLHFSDDVTIQWREVLIRGRQMHIDWTTQRGTLTDELSVSGPFGRFFPARMGLDLHNRSMTYHDVALKISPDNLNSPLWFRAQSVTQSEDRFSAHEVTWTPCNAPDPHTYIWAHQMHYTPDRSIWSLGSIWWVPLPLAIAKVPIPIPVYHYALGERSVVWNVPSVGRRDTPGWGWFVQNTIDYNLTQGKSSSVILDWFEYQGIGVGLTHIQPVGAWLTSWSVYRLDQHPTQQSTQKSAMSAWLMDNEWRITANVESVDGEKFNSLGRDVRNTRRLDMQYEDNGEGVGLSWYQQEDIRQKRNEWVIDTSYRFNQREYFSFSHQQTNTLATDTSYAKSKWGATLPLGSQSQVAVTGVLDRYVIRQAIDDLLRLNAEVHSTWNAWVTTRLLTNYRWDLDQDRYTADNRSGRNNILMALPQLDVLFQRPVHWSLDTSGVSLNQGLLWSKLTMGRFQEYMYDSARLYYRVYPQTQDMDALPNTVILDTRYNQSITLSYGGFSTQLASDFMYKQQVFRAPGRSWLDSDAGYLVGYTGQLDLGWSSIMGSALTYEVNHVPIQNNSPFYAFDLRTQKRNQLGGYVDFFVIAPSIGKWRHETQYNWITDQWNPYTTELSLTPHPLLLTSIRTGRLLSPKPSDAGREYLPTDFRLTIGTPTHPLRFSYYLTLDSNQWVYQQLFRVLQSSLSLAWDLLPGTDYSTSVGVVLQYQPTSDSFSWSQYTVQSISIAQKDHCRMYTFSYNNPMQEWSLQFHLLAFPEEKIGYMQQRSGWRFKGLWNDQSQERL